MGCARETCSTVFRVATGTFAVFVVVTGIAVAGFHAKVAAGDSVLVDRFYANDAWAYSSAVMLAGFGLALLTASFRPGGRLVGGVSVLGVVCAFALGSLAVGQAGVITRSGFGDTMTWSPFGGKVNMYDSTMQQAVSMAQECHPSDEVLFDLDCGVSVRADYDCGEYKNLQMAVDQAVGAATWRGALPSAADRGDRDRDRDRGQFLKDHAEKAEASLGRLPERTQTVDQIAKHMTSKMWARLLPTETEVEKCLELDVVFGAPSACLFAPTAAVFLSWRFIVFGALMFLGGSLLLVGALLSCCVPSAEKEEDEQSGAAGIAYQTERGPNNGPMPTAPQLSGPAYPAI